MINFNSTNKATNPLFKANANKNNSEISDKIKMDKAIAEAMVASGGVFAQQDGGKTFIC